MQLQEVKCLIQEISLTPEFINLMKIAAGLNHDLSEIILKLKMGETSSIDPEIQKLLKFLRAWADDPFNQLRCVHLYSQLSNIIDSSRSSDNVEIINIAQKTIDYHLMSKLVNLISLINDHDNHKCLELKRLFTEKQQLLLDLQQKQDDAIVKKIENINEQINKL